MIKRAFEPLEAFDFITLLSLVNQWMKLLFLPSVTECAFFQPLAPLLIACNEGATLPVLAEFGLIPEKIRFSSEILEIVRVYTLGFVVFVVVRAPFGFEKEDVKVEIRIGRQQIMDKTHFDVFYGMGERTIISVLTGSYFVWIAVAEFSFILIFVIQSLNPVMRPATLISLGTLFSVSELA